MSPRSKIRGSPRLRAHVIRTMIGPILRPNSGVDSGRKTLTLESNWFILLKINYIRNPPGGE